MSRQIDTQVCVVGGGVIGASIAYFLSRANIQVVLLESALIGSTGATGRSRGILRVYDPLPPLARLGKIGVQFYLKWAEAGDLGSSPTRHGGLLYRLHSQSVAQARAIAAALDSEELPLIVTRYAELKERHKSLGWNDADWVIFEPRGGYGDPLLTAQKLIAASRARGATVLERSKVQRLVRLPHDWRVHVQDLRVTARVVVLATGAYSTDLICDLPSYTRSIPIPSFSSHEPLPSAAVVDEIAHTYLRPESAHQFVAGCQVFSEGHWSELPAEVTPSQVVDARDRAALVLPMNVELTSIGGTSGFDSYTRDLMPLIGHISQAPDLIVATGLSGRGYKMAPAVGMAVTRLIGRGYDLGRALVDSDTIDLSAFSPSRVQDLAGV